MKTKIFKKAVIAFLVAVVFAIMLFYGNAPKKVKAETIINLGDGSITITSATEYKQGNETKNYDGTIVITGGSEDEPLSGGISVSSDCTAGELVIKIKDLYVENSSSFIYVNNTTTKLKIILEGDNHFTSTYGSACIYSCTDIEIDGADTGENTLEIISYGNGIYTGTGKITIGDKLGKITINSNLNSIYAVKDVDIKAKIVDITCKESGIKTDGNINISSEYLTINSTNNFGIETEYGEVSIGENQKIKKLNINSGRYGILSSGVKILAEDIELNCPDSIGIYTYCGLNITANTMKISASTGINFGSENVDANIIADNIVIDAVWYAVYAYGEGADVSIKATNAIDLTVTGVYKDYPDCKYEGICGIYVEEGALTLDAKTVTINVGETITEDTGSYSDKYAAICAYGNVTITDTVETLTVKGNREGIFSTNGNIEIGAKNISIDAGRNGIRSTISGAITISNAASVDIKAGECGINTEYNPDFAYGDGVEQPVTITADNINIEAYNGDGIWAEEDVVIGKGKITIVSGEEGIDTEGSVYIGKTGTVSELRITAADSGIYAGDNLIIKAGYVEIEADGDCGIEGDYGTIFADTLIISAEVGIEIDDADVTIKAEDITINAVECGVKSWGTSLSIEAANSISITVTGKDEDNVYDDIYGIFSDGDLTLDAKTVTINVGETITEDTGSASDKYAAIYAYGNVTIPDTVNKLVINGNRYGIYADSVEIAGRYTVIQGGVYDESSYEAIKADTITVVPATGKFITVTIGRNENDSEASIVKYPETTIITVEKPYFKAVNKAEVTITVVPATGLVYDGTAKVGYTGTLSVSVEGLADTLVYTYSSADGAGYSSAEAPVNSGSYKLTIAVPDDNPDYFGSTTIEFAIGKKEVTVTPKAVTITEGDEIPAIELEYTGLVGNDVITPEQTPVFVYKDEAGNTVDGATAGRYAIVWSNIADTTFKDAGNYKVVAVDGTLTVNERAHVHTVVTDAAVPATCTTTGLTEGSHCSVCNAVIVAQETVEALGHDWGEWKVVKEATETEKGKAERECTRCGEKEEKTLPVLGHTHTVVTDAAVAATCTTTGLTEGSHCSTCNEVIVAQETIAALGHDWSGEWKVVKEATATEDGKRETYCTRGCGQKKVEVIPTIGSADEGDTNGGALQKDAEVAPDAPVSEATLDNKKSELLNAANIFSAEEKAAIENGTDARVWLEVTRTDESSMDPTDKAEVKKAAEEIMGENPDITYFDADLFKQVGGSEKTQLHEPGIDIKVTIQIPNELLNHDRSMVREYKIIRLHKDAATGAGNVEVLGGSFNEATGEFTFATDKFSTYAIAYNDIPAENSNIIHVTEIVMSPEGAAITGAGETVQLTVAVSPLLATDRSVSWVSSDTGVATVDATGKVTAVGNGTCTITATTNDGNFSAVCTVTVNIQSDNGNDVSGGNGNTGNNESGSADSGSTGGSESGSGDAGNTGNAGNTGDGQITAPSTGRDTLKGIMIPVAVLMMAALVVAAAVYSRKKRMVR